MHVKVESHIKVLSRPILTTGRSMKKFALKSRMSSRLFLSAAEIQQKLLNRQLEYELLTLIRYLRSKCDIELNRAATRALYQISSDRDNCFILHQHGAVKVQDFELFLYFLLFSHTFYDSFYSS